MTQRFAVLQTEIEPSDLEQLRRAFRGVPRLTIFDAPAVCSECGGIVCRNFTIEQATTLQANLKAEGVEVEIVEESRLPVLPTGRMIRRIQFTPEALLIDDLIKGQIRVSWEQVSLIAAGSVQLTSFPRTRSEWEEVRTEHIHVYHGIAIPVTVRETKFDYSSRESSDWFLRAEIILRDGVTRYSIEAEQFNFASLGEGVAKDLAGNFCLLVRELAGRARKAVLSRGAASILADPCEFVYYPRKNALEEELIWMLWRGNTGEASKSA